MLDDLDHETVDFIDNYDGKYREPLVLPGKFPNLLVNGSDGIAVGMATHIPPHNLREVCRAPDPADRQPGHSLHELLEIIPGPDFPTGGIIMGRQGIIDAYRAGHGKITLRARAEVVEEGKETRPSSSARCRSRSRRIPLLEDIGQLVKDERIAGIRGVRDESSARNGEPVRIVVELNEQGRPAPGAEPTLPVLEAAEDGQHQHAGAGRRPAAVPHAQGDACRSSWTTASR